MATWTSLVKNATVGRCIVVAAADKGRNRGWNHYRLKDWQETWTQYGEKDPDGLAAYNIKTGVREFITFEGQRAQAWRIHDGTWVDVVSEDGGDLLIKLFQGKKPNLDTGRWPMTNKGALKPEDFDFPDRIDL
jgi:hypothetical protein